MNPEKKDTHSLIEHILSSKFGNVKLLSATPASIYKHSSFLYARDGTSLYVTIKFPVGTYTGNLVLYKVMLFPVPVKTKSNHATTLTDLPDYFLTSRDGHHYATLNANDLVKCFGHTQIYCPFNIALHVSGSASCISSIYSDKKEKVQKLCDFRYFHNHIEPMIHEITPSSVLIYRQPTVAMNCGKDQKFMRGCHFCIMNVPCRCSLSSESFYLSPHVSGTCQNGTTNVTYLHPVNLALLQEFFEPSVYSSLSGGTSFPNPVTFKNLPQFKLFNHSYSKFLANDKSNHLSLRRMVANAKKDETIFQSLEEPLLSGDIDLSTTWPTTTDYLAMVALGLAIICTAALLYMGYKLRTVMTALVILQKSKVAKAATIETPTFVYNDGSRLIDTQNEMPSLPLDHSSCHVTSYYVLVFYHTCVPGILY